MCSNPNPCQKTAAAACTVITQLEVVHAFWLIREKRKVCLRTQEPVWNVWNRTELCCNVKGTVSRYFRHFFIFKKHVNWQKLFREFFVFAKIFSKNVCPRCRWLRGHDNDYADTFGKLWRLLTDFKGTLRWKKINTPKSNKLKT